MKIIKGKKVVLFLVACSLLLVTAHPVDALTIVPQCAHAVAAQTTPGVECIVFTFINVARLILGISGSVALALFIYGGFLMLVSGGNEQLITKGKSVLSGALIGLIIVFSAYTGVFFLVKTLTSGNGDLGDLLECIDTTTGAYKPSSKSCGDGGHCEAGICVAKPARATEQGEAACCVIISEDTADCSALESSSGSDACTDAGGEVREGTCASQGECPQ